MSLDDSTKSGFAKLLKSFDNTDDVVKITRAFALASRASKDRKMESRISHPLRASLILSEELKIHDRDILCAALLHDTLEGGSVTDEELKEQFGERVHGIVRALTKPKPSNPEEKEEILKEYFKSIANGPKDARYVKLADRLDNVRTLKKAGQNDKMMRYKEETQKYVIPIAEKTDEKLVLKLSVALYELKT